MNFIRAVPILRTGRRRASAIYFGLGALICAAPAFAGSIDFTGSYGVQYNYYSTEAGASAETSGLVQPSLSSLPLTAGNSGSTLLCCGASQSGQFSISSSYGSLSASSSANAYGVDGEGAGVNIDSGIGGGVEYWGAGMALFIDEFGITSSTLADGTPVTLTLDFFFTGSSSFASDGAETSDAEDGAFYQILDPAEQTVVFGGNGTFSQSLTVDTQVGDVFTVQGQLDADGTADSGDGHGGASSFSAAASSSMDIAGITDGACVVTQSGTDYGQNELCGNASAAPEPSTLILLALAAPAFFLVRRKRLFA